MNRYKKEEEKKEINEIISLILSGATKKADEIIKKRDLKQKMHFYITLRNLLNEINMQKKEEEKQQIVPAKPIYSDEDIEFLKQFDVIDLTAKEASLVGKGREFRTWERSLFSQMDDKAGNYIDEQLEKINGEYTPRLIINYWNEYKNMHQKKK